MGTKLAGREELKGEWERFQKQRVCGSPTENRMQHVCNTEIRTLLIVHDSLPHNDFCRTGLAALRPAFVCSSALIPAPDPMQEARKMAAEVDYHGVCILKVWLQSDHLVV